MPFVNNDTLIVSGEATLEVWRSIVNHGTVELIGGTDSNPEMSFVNNGEFHNASGGEVIGIGPDEPKLYLGRSSSFGAGSVGTFRNDGTVILAGQFLVFDGSTLINTGTFDNSAGSTTTLGKMTVDDTATLLPGTLYERQKHWTGGGDATSWSDPANWSPFPVIPSSSNQRVFIEGTPDGAAITIDVDAHVRTLTVDPEPGLLDLTIAPGVSLAIGTFNQNSFLFGGTHLTNYGTLAIDFLVSVRANASVDNQGTLTVTDILSNSGELTNAGDLTVTATGEISNYGTFTNTGAITNDGEIRNSEGGLFDNFSALDNTAGTFNNDGTFISECGSYLLGTISGNPPVVIPCDTTPPVITVPAEITVIATGPLGSVVTYSVSAIDNVDGAITAICTPPSGTTFPIGTTAVVCSATDTHDNTATAEFDINVQYDFSGFYAPLEEGKVYKLGRTLPVKFQLFFVDGTPAVTATPTIQLQRLSGLEPIGEPIDASSTSEADSGNIFRLSEDMYVYNLATKDLQKGYYRIEMDVGDGSSPKTVEIAFK